MRFFIVWQKLIKCSILDETGQTQKGDIGEPGKLDQGGASEWRVHS